MARGLVAFGGAMLTTLDFVAGLVDVRDMTFSFRFVGEEFVSGMPAPLLSGAVFLDRD
jgi:hypothetical protein